MEAEDGSEAPGTTGRQLGVAPSELSLLLLLLLLVLSEMLLGRFELNLAIVLQVGIGLGYCKIAVPTLPT